MPKADQFFGLGKLMEQYPESKYFIALIIGLTLVLWGCANYGEAATLAALKSDLSSIEGIEYYSLDEFMVIVGPAWGYNVSRDGIVTLVDGKVDLKTVCS